MAGLSVVRLSFALTVPLQLQGEDVGEPCPTAYLKAFRQASGMCSLSNFFSESRNVSTFPIMIFAAFQLLSLGILPPGAVRIMTAAVTLTTASGGDPKDFSSVRLFYRDKRMTVTPEHHVATPSPFLSTSCITLFRVSRASCAAKRAGSALARSVSQAFCFSVTF